MSLDDRYIIDTPENIEFSYNVAGIGSRFMAAIIDTVILGIIITMLLVVFSALASAISDIESAFIVTVLIISANIFFILGYYIFFELVWNGQSPGKRAVRLRVVREGGRPITFTASAIRNIVRLIDFLPGFYGLGVLVMFVDKRARRLGDLTGGTLVVKERHAISLETLGARAEPLPLSSLIQNVAPTDLLPNVHLLTHHDYELVQEFLRRRNELGRESRQRLGTQLTQGICNRMGVSLPSSNYELFLERVVRDYRLVQQAATQQPAQ